MSLKVIPALCLILILSCMLGCSSGGGTSPVSPDQNHAVQIAGNHQSWGLWQFTADPVDQTLDIIPIRGADMHVNALVFLEPPALVNLTLESLQFNGNLITADIGLRHPFIGLTEFSGFDVCGVFISNWVGNGIRGFISSDDWQR